MIPQAFTTRDMSEAYKWLQTLPVSVREEIKSMEQLVSLYLRAKRLGGSLPTKEELNSPPTQPPHHESSKSSQEFQKTLKNLRQELEQFDFAGAGGLPDPHLSPTPSSPDSVAPPMPPNLLAALRLDPRSRQLINEIREGLNLSSDVEVIRMSLVLAHKSLKGLL